MTTNWKSQHSELDSNDSCPMTFPTKKIKMLERIRGTHGSQRRSPDSHPPLLVPILIDVNQSPPSVRPLKIRHPNPQHSGLTWHKIQVPKMTHKIGSCFDMFDLQTHPLWGKKQVQAHNHLSKSLVPVERCCDQVSSAMRSASNSPPKAISGVWRPHNATNTASFNSSNSSGTGNDVTVTSSGGWWSSTCRGETLWWFKSVTKAPDMFFVSAK